MGLCNGRASGGNSQSGKKKINNFNSVTAEGSVLWLANNRIIKLEVGHQQNITPETILSSKLQYSDKENGSINIRIRSHDHLEITFCLLIPLLRNLWTQFLHAKHTIYFS